MAKYDYDLIIIGGGAAGFVSAKVARGFGKTVAMIEKGKLGGECTNYGCIPSKSLIRAARAAHEMKNLDKLGLKLDAPLSFNTDNVMSHVRSIVQKVYNTHLPESFKSLGIDVIFGSPQFLDNHRIKIGEKILSADKFIVSTGSSPSIPPVDGINEAPYLTNNTIFSLDKLPASLIVMGGGPIGIELSSAFNRLNVEVTVVEMLDRILIKEDKELSDKLAERLKSEGLKIMTSAKAVRVSKSNGKIRLSVEEKEGAIKEIDAEGILVATGRKPNTEGLALEKAEVKYNNKGIEVNDRLQTSANNIYACGDVVGHYQFSHIAEYHGVIACSNAFLPIKKRVDYRNVIWCTFTDPELAHAGLTEDEAREAYGNNIKILHYDYSKFDRARTDMEEFGMSKIILDNSGKVLGVHILGTHASEIIHEVQLAKHFNIPFGKIWEAIHIYPSYSDVIRQPSKYYYAERLRNNPFIKLINIFLS
ncbi:MAG: FAD-dependent oxidoreductase [Nitrospinae bacterium]|nr:FAD-dependent oxidoreductase [Nitrospinota bacterium]